MSDEELQSKLLIVSEISYRVEQLYLTCGSAAVTAERITEIAAEAVMGEIAASARICPGWGRNQNHLWAYKKDAPPKQLGAGMMERCDSHPERRQGGERRA